MDQFIVPTFQPSPPTPKDGLFHQPLVLYNPCAPSPSHQGLPEQLVPGPAKGEMAPSCSIRGPFPTTANAPGARGWVGWGRANSKSRS